LNNIGPQRAIPKSIRAIAAEVRQLRNQMIRPYTLDEAITRFGEVPPYTKIKHELDRNWSVVHGLVISDGHLFARIFDGEYYESIGLDVLAQEWVWEDGSPCGEEA